MYFLKEKFKSGDKIRALRLQFDPPPYTAEILIMNLLRAFWDKPINT